MWDVKRLPDHNGKRVYKIGALNGLVMDHSQIVQLHEEIGQVLKEGAPTSTVEVSRASHYS